MYTVQRETFEGENFRKFQGFVATHQSFLCKFWGCSVCWRHKQAIHDSFLRTNHIFHHFTRVFSLESFQYLQNILLKAATLLVQYCVTMAMAHDDLWLDFCTIKPILIWPLNFPPQRSDFGLVILDDLHRLVEYVQVGGQITVSHALLHALTTLLTTTPLAGVCVRVCVRACVWVCVRVCACVRTCVSRGIHAEQERLIHPSPAGTKLLVVGTMAVTDSAGLEEPSALGLPELFTQQHFVPLLDTKSATTFISARNIHR